MLVEPEKQDYKKIMVSGAPGDRILSGILCIGIWKPDTIEVEILKLFTDRGIHLYYGEELQQ